MLELWFERFGALTISRKILNALLIFYASGIVWLPLLWLGGRAWLFPAGLVMGAAMAAAWAAVLMIYIGMAMRMPGGLNGWRLALALLPVVNSLWIPVEMVRGSVYVTRHSRDGNRHMILISGIGAALLLLAAENMIYSLLFGELHLQRFFSGGLIIMPLLIGSCVVLHEMIVVKAQQLPVIPVGPSRRQRQFTVIWGGGMVLLMLFWLLVEYRNPFSFVWERLIMLLWP